MAFREKMAWLTLVAMLIAYGIYFPLVSLRHYSSMGMLWLFASVTITQMVAVIIISATMAIRAGKESRAPADERDKSIAQRGTNIAYYILMVGMIFVGIIMPHTALKNGVHIINAALFALVIAEAARLITIVVSYRRGWHG